MGMVRHTEKVIFPPFSRGTIDRLLPMATPSRVDRQIACSSRTPRASRFELFQNAVVADVLLTGQRFEPFFNRGPSR